MERLSKKSFALAALVVCTVLIAGQGVGLASTYYLDGRCKLPPPISSGTKPNVMVILDYSGSMAMAAYQDELAFTYVAKKDTSEDQYTHIMLGMGTYNPLTNYYGLFNSNKYYAYDGSAANKEYFYESNPTTNIVSSSDAGSGKITFTCESSPGLLAGDVATLSGLDKHTALNGNSYKVESAGGNTFTITAAWSPPGESDSTGQVRRRTTAPITKSASGGSGTIKFTTKTAHLLATNDVVVLTGLNIHKTLNENAYTVTVVDSTSFKVTATWSGTTDTTGYFEKRTIGSFNTAISGNVLNFYTTTRIDAALKALIGGRADCPDGDSNCYLKGQGSRRTLQESTRLNASFFMDLDYSLDTTATTYPAYDSNFPYRWYSDNYWEKTIFLSVRDYQHTGYIDDSDTASGAYPGWNYEEWEFTLTEPTYVSLGMYPTWSGRYCGVRVYDISSGSYVEVTPQTSFITGIPGTDIKYWHNAPLARYQGLWEKDQLPAGTYRVLAYGSKDSSNNGTYYLYANLALTPTAGGQTATASKIGNRANKSRMQMRVKVPADQRKGVLQESFNELRIGVMSFHSSRYGDCDGDCGQIALGCDNTDIKRMIKAVQADTPRESTDEPTYKPRFPLGGTPTAGSVYEAIHYFKQSASGRSSNDTNANRVPSSANAGFLRPRTQYDPYYDQAPDGSLEFRPCRKSFVLMVTDGVPYDEDYSPSSFPRNNDVRDPSKASYELHTSTLRTSADGEDYTKVPKADLYSIFTFGGADSESLMGKRCTRTMALFGGFKDWAGTSSGCTAANGWPYPFSTWNFDSRNVWYPTPLASGGYTVIQSYCNPGGTYNECCKEWDRIWDIEGEGADAEKGHPDNYFDADDGGQLERGLRSALQAMAGATGGAGGAVATVYRDKEAPEEGQQQTEDYLGDLVLRGVFEANNPTATLERRYYWFGHVEVFWPFQITVDGEITETYDFERPENVDAEGNIKLCKDIDTKHCWDAAVVLKDRINASSGWDTRTIYVRNQTWNTTDQRPQITTSTTNLMLLPISTYGYGGTSTDTLKMWNFLLRGRAKTGSTERTNLQRYVKWLRGKDDSYTTAYRRRCSACNPVTDYTDIWSLGDIVFSTPVIMGIPAESAVSENDVSNPGGRYPSGTGDTTSYQTFYEAGLAAKRPQVMYVGANDGMVHAFVIGRYIGTTKRYANNVAEGCTDCGKELWAFVPTTILSELRQLSTLTYGTESGCKHRAMVDLAPKAYQVFINGAWKTVIIGGLRGGGDSYFALDVTDPESPKLLWEYSVIKDLVNYDGATYSTIEAAYAHYDELKLIPVSWSKASVGRVNLGTISLPTEDPNTSGQPVTLDPGLTGNRHVAFIGGGFRIFDRKFEFTDGTDPDGTLPTVLQRPFLLALDIATGKNLFRYVWPYIQHHYGTTFFPYITRNRDVYGIPYAMSDVILLDYLRKKTDGTISSETDGYVDHLYVGDMNGVLYGMKFNLLGTGTQGVRVDMRLSKEVDESETLAAESWSNFRSKGHPITVQPQAKKDTVDGQGTGYLRVVFGTGKYDDVLVAKDDKSDPAKMTLYNLKDVIGGTTFDGATINYAPPTLETGGDAVGGEIADSGFNVYLRSLCDSFAGTDGSRERTYNAGCRWFTESGGVTTPDCCESNCSTACFQCVYDFTQGETALPGERVTSDALIWAPTYGDPYVFVTTFVPPTDPCNYSGNGYLYAFNLNCTTVANPFRQGGTIIGEDVNGVAYRVDLGEGVPSNPVLDSQGRFLFIQMSNRMIVRIEIEGGSGGGGGGGGGGGTSGSSLEIRGWTETEN